MIISQSVAQRMFPNQDAVNRHITWTDPVIKFIPGFSPDPMRIVGVYGDFDDEHVIPEPATDYLSSLRTANVWRRDVCAHQRKSVWTGGADHTHDP